MRAIEIVDGKLCPVERAVPVLGPGEVLVRVAAAGVSRADVLQRRGSYPPPPGASDVPGLECSGTIVRLGDGVTDWHAGDRVCAILAGGGYAEFAAVSAFQLLPVPEGWSFVEAATLPENMFTVWDNVFTRAGLRAGESILVHGATSGIGTTAVMLAKAFGARVFATAGSPAKCAAATAMGAELSIDYRNEDFVERVLAHTQGLGADVVLDVVGGEYVARDVRALAPDGRIACLATLGGAEVRLDLSELMKKRGTIFATGMRSRSPERKGRIRDDLRERVWPLLAAKDPIVPAIDATFPLARAAEAHARLESGVHVGKIVLSV